MGTLLRGSKYKREYNKIILDISRVMNGLKYILILRNNLQSSSQLPGVLRGFKGF